MNTIKAYGFWDTFHGQWAINTSEILSQLIKDAGRYCEHYASDLFITWEYEVEDFLKKGCRESETIRFGFRNMGVDHETWIEINEMIPEYYNVIRELKIEVENNSITMTMEV